MKKVNGNFLQAGAWSILGTFLIKGTYMLTIPLFSRLLSVEEYGEVSIFLTYASVLTIVLSANLVAAVSPGIVKYKEKKQFLSSTMVLSIVIFLCLFLQFQIFHTFWQNVLELSRTQMNLLLLYSFSQYVLNYNSTRLIMDYRYKTNTAISFAALFLDTVLSAALILTIFKASRVDGRIWGAAIPNAAAAVLIICYIIWAGKCWYHREHWKFAITISFPMIFHGLAHIVLGQADRIMIKRMIGAREAGIYGLVYNIAIMLAALVTALNNVWIPWMFRKLKVDDTEIVREKADHYVHWFTLITFMLLTFSPEVIKILSPAKYWEGISLMLPIVIASFFTFLYTLYVNVEIFYEKPRGIAVGTVAAALINIILNYLLLPVFGYQAAAYTTVASYLLLLIFHFFLCKKVWKKDIYDNRVILLAGVAASLYALVIYGCLELLPVRIILGMAIIGYVLWRKPPLPELDI